jgi:hypothetical protein
MNKLGIILINHHHGELAFKTIQRLMTLESQTPFNLFVVNNLPDEKLSASLSQHYPAVELITNPKPQGFASNINSVIRSNPEHEYFMLLNPDVICLPGIVDTLIRVMENNPTIGVTGPKLMYPDGRPQASARNFPSLIALVIRSLRLDKTFQNSRHLKNYMMQDVEMKELSEVDWLMGAVMMIRKAALDDVGLMDERFYMYFEDEDLCARMWRGGWRVCYVPEAQAYHVHMGESRKRLLSKAGWHHTVSGIKMFIKYRGKITR